MKKLLTDEQIAEIYEQVEVQRTLKQFEAAMAYNVSQPTISTALSKYKLKMMLDGVMGFEVKVDPKVVKQLKCSSPRVGTNSKQNIMRRVILANPDRERLDILAIARKVGAMVGIKSAWTDASITREYNKSKKEVDAGLIAKGA